MIDGSQKCNYQVGLNFIVRVLLKSTVNCLKQVISMRKSNEDTCRRTQNGKRPQDVRDFIKGWALGKSTSREDDITYLI